MSDELKLQRTRAQWAGCDPKLMAQQSPAAIMYALQDAKRDIDAMHRQADALAADNKRLREALEFIARLHIIPPYMTPQASQLILMKGHADAALAGSNGGVMDADLKAERDELRAQVLAMLALMAEAVPALQHISDTAQDLESFTLAERFRLVLQAKP